MKLQLKPRELLWMSLPSILLGCAAWWLSSGGRMSVRLSDIRQTVENARRPSLVLQKVGTYWLSPTHAASTYDRPSCIVSVEVVGSANWKQSYPANPPTFTDTDLVDSRGRSLAAPWRTATGKPQHYRFDPWVITTPTSDGSGKKYRVAIQVAFSRLPKTASSVFFVGNISWGGAKIIPVKVEVSPPWMRRGATRLRLLGVNWVPSLGNKGVQVEVDCRVSHAHNPHVFGLIPHKSVDSLGIGVGYDPETLAQLGKREHEDVLLAEWSQHVESGDGKINSLALLSQYIPRVQMSSKRVFHNNKEVLDSFSPLPLPPRVEIKNDLVRLIYKVPPLPPLYKNPIFRCEIYLVGDGMVSVRCPLNTKDMKQAR